MLSKLQHMSEPGYQGVEEVYRLGAYGLDACSNPRLSSPTLTPKVYTLAPEYLFRDYFKAEVYTIWVHGPYRAKDCRFFYGGYFPKS